MSHNIELISETVLLVDSTTKISVTTMLKSDLLYVGISIRDYLQEVPEMKTMIQRLNTLLPRGLSTNTLLESVDTNKLRSVIASLCRQWWKLLPVDKFRTDKLFPRPTVETVVPTVVSRVFALPSSTYSMTTTGAPMTDEEEIADMERQIQIISDEFSSFKECKDNQNSAAIMNVYVDGMKQEVSKLDKNILQIKRRIFNMRTSLDEMGC